MRLFTVAASIVSLVAGIAIGHAIFPEPRGQVGDAYWCGKIAGEEWALGEIFHDRDPVLGQKVPECDGPQKVAEGYDKGHGTELAGRLHNLFARFSGQSEVASFVPPKSLAATP
jgi:hypothetical protein